MSREILAIKKLLLNSLFDYLLTVSGIRLVIRSRLKRDLSQSPGWKITFNAARVIGFLVRIDPEVSKHGLNFGLKVSRCMTFLISPTQGLEVEVSIFKSLERDIPFAFQLFETSNVLNIKAGNHFADKIGDVSGDVCWRTHKMVVRRGDTWGLGLRKIAISTMFEIQHMETHTNNTNEQTRMEDD